MKKETLLPKFLKDNLDNPKMQKALAKFSCMLEEKTTGKNTISKKVNFHELTTYRSKWETSVTGEARNPENISLSTMKLMRQDAQIQMGLKVIKNPIKAIKWWIISEDKKVEYFVEYNIKKIWIDMLNVILNSLDFGYSISEKIWELEDVDIIHTVEGKDESVYKGKAILLKKLKDPDVDYLTILVDDKGDFNGFEQKGAGNTYVIVPANKSFVFTNEKEFGNLYGKSRLKYAYDYWYWCTLMYQFLNRYMERRGTPPTKCRAPLGKVQMADGSTKDNLVLIQQAGESLTESSVVALPATTNEKGDFTWNIEYMQDDQRSDMFLKYIEHLNNMKLRALFVPERMMVQDTAMGARSVAEVHYDVFISGLEGLITDIVDHINKYIIPQIVEYNFGSQVKAELKTTGLSQESKDIIKQIVLAVVNRGDGTLPIDMIKSLEDLGIPVQDKKEQKQEESIIPKSEEKVEDKPIEKIENKPEENKDVQAEQKIDNTRAEYRVCELRRLLK